MAIWDRFRRKINNDNMQTVYHMGDFITNATNSGVIVDVDTALKVTAAYAAVNVISGAIATIPFNLYQKMDNGGRVKLTDNPLHRLLNYEWNEYLTAFRGWRILMVNALLTEAGYIEIVRRNGIPYELYPIPTKFVTKKINYRTLKPEYEVRIDNLEPRTIKANNMIEIPGLASTGYTAYDPVNLLAEALGLSKAAENFASEYFGEGTHPTAIITYPPGLKRMQDDQFRSEIRQSYTGLGKRHRLMILEDGLKFEKVAVSANEGQMIESREFQVQEVARFFNIPPHKIQDMSRATWSNIEELNISFANDTLLPWIRNIEQACYQALLFPQQKEQGIYCEFDLNAMLRGKISERYDAYQKAISYGWLSPDEVRERENLPAIPGGNGKKHYIAANLNPIEGD